MRAARAEGYVLQRQSRSLEAECSGTLANGLFHAENKSDWSKKLRNS